MHLPRQRITAYAGGYCSRTSVMQCVFKFVRGSNDKADYDSFCDVLADLTTRTMMGLQLHQSDQLQGVLVQLKAVACFKVCMSVMSG